MARSLGNSLKGFMVGEGDAASGDDVTADELMSSEYNLPLILTDKRHMERILGTDKPSGTWRMKERVSSSSNYCLIE